MLNERQQQILNLLKEHNRLSVAQLAKHCYVSEMTVRRDLKVLEGTGFVARYNGGAVYTAERAFLPFSSRQMLHHREKEQLAAQVRGELHDGMTVYIDFSSTCGHVVPLLAEYHDVRVVTNSVHNLLLAGQYRIPCLLAGGEYLPEEMCLIGQATADFFAGLNIDVGFFSSAGITQDGIISDHGERQCALRRVVMARTARKIFLFTGEKVGLKFLYTLCRRRDIDRVICL